MWELRETRLPTSLQANDVINFRWKKEVTVEAVPPQRLIAIPLDEAIFASTRDGFPDVRLLDASGEPLNFLIRKKVEKQERIQREQWTVKQPQLMPKDDSLEITFSLDKDDGAGPHIR